MLNIQTAKEKRAKKEKAIDLCLALFNEMQANGITIFNKRITEIKKLINNSRPFTRAEIEKRRAKRKKTLGICVRCPNSTEGQAICPQCKLKARIKYPNKKPQIRLI